jgi:site-specific DNA-adenine methylase
LSGSVFLGNDLTAKKNWINDIDKDLVNFYKVIQNEDSKNELFRLLNDQIATKERHLEIKNYKPKNKIERAF